MKSIQSKILIFRRTILAENVILKSIRNGTRRSKQIIRLTQITFISLKPQINLLLNLWLNTCFDNWAAPSEFGTYRLCEQRRFRRACASAQSRQNLRCSLIQAVSQEEPSDRKPDPWPLWMAGHAQLKFVMTECSKTQIRLARLNFAGIMVIATFW